MIGNNAKEFVDKQVASQERFFQRLTELPSTASVPILRKCGVPRFNYLSRTHKPEDTLEAATLFDTRVRNVLMDACGIQKLSEEQEIIAHLPMAMGGLGITSFATLGDIPYVASKNSKPQDAPTKELNKALRDSLPKDVQTFLSQTKRTHASDWLTPTSSTWMNPSLFSQAIRLRLRDTPIETKHCVCGFSGPTSDMTTHVLGCAKVQGTGVGWRHNVIKYKIAAFCRERLVPTTVEPYLVKHLDNKQSRADLCVTTPDGNLYIDLVVANKLCTSHKHKSNEELDSEKQKLKESKYLREVTARGAEFATLLVEVNGGHSTQGKKAVATIEKACACAPGELFRVISSTLQLCNATIVRNAARVL